MQQSYEITGQHGVSLRPLVEADAEALAAIAKGTIKNNVLLDDHVMAKLK